MFTKELLTKYNALPSEKQEDIDNFILAICESEKQKQLRNEVEARRQEVKEGEKTASAEFWNEVNEL